MGKVTTRPAGNLRLSQNFFLSELTASDTAERLGIANQPDAIALGNLHAVAELLERVRKLLGNKPILVSSGYRGPELNARIGGSKTSDHMRGQAADFRCPAFGSPLEICRAIVASDIPFGQLIWEGTWVHISLPDGTNDREVLTATFKGGRATYSKGLPA